MQYSTFTIASYYPAVYVVRAHDLKPDDPLQHACHISVVDGCLFVGIRSLDRTSPVMKILDVSRGKG